MKTLKNQIPAHSLTPDHSKLHREPAIKNIFGSHQLSQQLHIPGFEMYSSDGMLPSYSPSKSSFYRFGLLINGSLHVQIGLEHFNITAGTVIFTAPGQVHAKSDVSEDLFGYYILFEDTFLQNLLPSTTLQQEFPFFDYSGIQVFQCVPEEINEMTELINRINIEIRGENTGRATAIKMYLYLLLLAAKRSYERQELSVNREPSPVHHLVTRFHKLVAQHFLELRHVADYAKLLHVTPNYLNRTVKAITNQTASDAINEMLVQEAKVLLRYTELSSAEIAYKLNFSEPSAFNHFFRKQTGNTPGDYRNTCQAESFPA